ncbi:MAG TPA: creatininase family protein, partial [bacterium]|nr:creatininase family protein [bacterium]
RKKNDIVSIPIGCTEQHGDHTVTALDTFMVTQILEGVRRYTAKKGAACNLVFSPLNYGGHPHHHIGMPGTVHLEDEVVKRNLIDVMVGLWNDGFRKQILVNNHGHSWLMEAAIQELQKRWNLPGIFRTLDWHRSVREFFRTKARGGEWDDDFVHADEAETSVMLLLEPRFVEMNYAEETKVEAFCRTAISTRRSIPSAGRAAGARARATPRSSSPRCPRGWLDARPSAAHRRPNARSRPSSPI